MQFNQRTQIQLYVRPRLKATNIVHQVKIELTFQLKWAWDAKEKLSK